MSALPAAADNSLSLDNEHENEIISLLRDSAEDFCKRSLDPGRLRALRDDGSSFDRQQWQTIAELGWLGVAIAEDAGGLGLGAQGAATISRSFGEVAAPEPLIETAVAAATLIASVGKQGELLDTLIDGSNVCVAALGNVDTADYTATTASEEVGIFLDGSINAVPLGTAADTWLVPATFGGEPAWFAVSGDAHGVEVVPRPLSDDSVDAQLVFDHCPATLLAHGVAAVSAAENARTLAELASSAYQLGLAETLLAKTNDYVSTRTQFGQAIGSFQSLQHRLVDCFIAVRLADAVVEQCINEYDRGATDEQALLLASRARQRSGETLSLIAREAIQLHGAIGYTDECDIGLFINRALVVAARYGRSDTHLARYVRLQPTIVARKDDNQEIDHELANLEPPGGDWNALDDETFRGVVRHWHAANYPPELRNLRHRARWAQCKQWYMKLYERGFAAPGWPAEHGGMGLKPDKLLIFIEERERLGIARTPDQGIIMVGPLLMQHGTPEQQAHYLPKALSAEHIWCQGYSEPNAGSDLASLKTTAVRDGDEFVINGQKIWTTMAQDANQMFCLVRTDAQAKPQAGISFVLIDFATPGITVRPIRNIAGDEEFCEVFLDDVRVPCANLVGELNDGWKIAKALLGFERFFIGSPKFCRSALGRIAELAVAQGLDDDPVTVNRYTRLKLDVDALEASYKSFADQIRRGEALGADISMLKIFASETFQRQSEFILDLGGEAAAQLDGVETPSGAIDALSPYYNSRPTTIYGGSNEIQRNIMAKFVLRLPSK
ncbi:MAG: acyl-CoA dehydrogenase [Gammaproteobacteria bacterium]